VSRYVAVPLDLPDASTAEAIRAVMAAAYAVEAALLGVEDFPPLRRTTADIVASGSRFLGVWSTDTLAAVAELERPEPGRVDVASLVVLPSHFRRGLGGALVRFVLDAHPADDVTVSTSVRNQPALRLYASHGFVEDRRWTTGDGSPMVTLRVRTRRELLDGSADPPRP
jgi:ribosomal protein S18 acetylase RimI-like enzyme